MAKKKIRFNKQLIIPLAALLALALFNLIVDPSFFKITMSPNSAGHDVLSGNLITILDYGSELAILAIGMTLVTAASGGQDISVGATIAIAGSVILKVVRGDDLKVEPGAELPVHFLCSDRGTVLLSQNPFICTSYVNVVKCI